MTEASGSVMSIRDGGSICRHNQVHVRCSFGITIARNQLTFKDHGLVTASLSSCRLIH
jgi:hypothetical protein